MAGTNFVNSVVRIAKRPTDGPPPSTCPKPATSSAWASATLHTCARRRSEASWRLIGLTIRLPPDADPAKPSLDDFIAERELDGWSHTEVLAMYQEAYPSDRKTNRRSRLRDEQLALLRRLEKVAAEQPEATDLVSGWFDELVSAKLISAGLMTLADLNHRIAAGGRWYTALPAIGEAKARRIESHLATLLPRAVRPARPVFALSPTSRSS